MIVIRTNESNRSRRIFAIAGIAVAAAVFLILLSLIVWGLTLKTGSTVFPNVCVSGVNIGGMDRDEAVQALDASLSTTHATRTLTVRLPDRKLVFDPALANVPLDTAAMVDSAMAYGREGNIFRVLSTYIHCKEEAYILDTDDFLQVDEGYIRSLIDETAREVQREMVQSQVTMDEEKAVITIRLGYNGRSLDAAALSDLVLAAYDSGDLSDITFAYDMVPYDIVDLRSYYDQYCTDPRDAYYNETTRSLTKEVIGYGFDLIAANQQLALAEEGSTIEIPLQVIEPKITLAQLKDTYFSDTLASYNSPYWSNANRTENLRLACKAINGTVLNPGEVFSFNQTVGERTAEKGYKNGIVYAEGGASESQLGGGICQVASTIYYCTLMADFPAVERAPHMYTVDYVPKGMDATVYWGSLDFKFKNTNETPIMINAKVKDGYVRVSITGTMEHDYTVKMTSECVATIPYETVEQLDERKPVGYSQQKQSPYMGYTYWSYKNFYDLDGNFLRTEKCAISEYDKRDEIVIVGPKAAPEGPFVPLLPDDLPDVTIPPDPNAPVPNGDYNDRHRGGLLDGWLFP